MSRNPRPSEVNEMVAQAAAQHDLQLWYFLGKQECLGLCEVMIRNDYFFVAGVAPDGYHCIAFPSTFNSVSPHAWGCPKVWKPVCNVLQFKKGEKS